MIGDKAGRNNRKKVLMGRKHDNDLYGNWGEPGKWGEDPEQVEGGIDDADDD